MYTRVSQSCCLMFMAAILGWGCGKNGSVQVSAKQELTIKGSNTELKLVKALQEGYSKSGKGILISVEGGGSSTGIEALLKNKIDIANSSREIFQDEEELFKTQRRKLQRVIFAVDAVAVITNSRLGIDSLSLQQLQMIFAGEITNWKNLGGPDKPIHLMGRDDKSGTHHYFEQKVLPNGYSNNIVEKETYEEIVEAVKNDPQAIGYVSLGSIVDPSGKPSGDVWAMYLYIDGGKAISPYEINPILLGEYPLIRPLFQYYTNTYDSAVIDFIRYELSVDGQNAMRLNGFFPINEYHKEINKKTQGFTEDFSIKQ